MFYNPSSTNNSNQQQEAVGTEPIQGNVDQAQTELAETNSYLTQQTNASSLYQPFKMNQEQMAQNQAKMIQGIDFSKMMAVFDTLSPDLMISETEDLSQSEETIIPYNLGGASMSLLQPGLELEVIPSQECSDTKNSNGSQSTSGCVKTSSKRAENETTLEHTCADFETTAGNPSADSKTQKSYRDRQPQQNCDSDYYEPKMVKHNSEAPQMTPFILSNKKTLKLVNIHHSQQEFQQNAQITQLKQELQLKNDQVSKLTSTLSKITQCLAKIYSSPQLLSNDIEDKELLKILSEGFLSQAKLHLAFLFSAPLILKYKDEESNSLKSQTIFCIDHAQEFSGVLDSLSNTGNQIRFRKIPATLDNLRLSLTENPIALHFSGHGIENNRDNFGSDCALIKGEGNFLIFEDTEGCAQYLSEKRLHELLEASGTKLEFVFVASCYSQFAGEIFHNAGAKHVICVRRGEKISDEASIIFSKHFYNALFSQTRTVCQAFELAKASLHAEKNKYVSNEYQKFIILKDTDDLATYQCTPSGGYPNPLHQMQFQKDRPKKHKCSVFGPFMKGQIQNVGREPLFKLEVSKVEDFLGRKREMQEVISFVMQNRLVTIKGIPGIGKTTLAKAAAFYIDERNLFHDGIILLTLRKIDQATMFLTRLYLALSKHMPVVKDNEKVEGQEQLQQRIIDFLRDKELLIVLDNVEDPLRTEGCDFKEIIKDILTRCPKITLLLTSRIAFGSLDDISEKIIHLKELSQKVSKELLFLKAMRPIEDKEIQDLFKSAEPIRVLQSNPHRENKFSLNLEDHHIFDLLGGHPHAISLAAPLLQEKKTLTELYKLLNSYDILDVLGTDLIEGKQIAPLKMSLETSIEQLKLNDPQAVMLFCLMGLLPGGCSEEDLDTLWGKNWAHSSERLLRASLLVKRQQLSGENKYTLLPFMNKFAEQKMSEKERTDFHLKCCKYFGNICQSLFQLNQNFNLTNALNLNEVMNKIVQIETNIWACIYRIVDNKKTQDTTIGENNSRSENSVTRVKSPVPSVSDYPNTQVPSQIKMSNDDSSQESGCFQEQVDDQQKYDDNYEKLLCKRRNATVRLQGTNNAAQNEYDDNYDEMLKRRSAEKGRSQSEKPNQIMRSLMGEHQDFTNDEIEESKEEASELKQSIYADQIKLEQLAIGVESEVTDIEDKILITKFKHNRTYYNQNEHHQFMMLSHQEEKLTEDFQNQFNQLQQNHDTMFKSQQITNDLHHVFPTKSIANHLSDDHISLSFNQAPSHFIKVSEQNLIYEGKEIQSVCSEGEEVTNQSQEIIDNDEENNNQPTLVRQNSGESTNTLQLSMIGKKPQFLTSKNLLTLSEIKPHNFNEGEIDSNTSVIGYQDFQYDSSSMDTSYDNPFPIQNKLYESGHDSSSYQQSTSQNNQTRRKSVKNIAPSGLLVQVNEEDKEEEEKDEESLVQQDQDNAQPHSHLDESMCSNAFKQKKGDGNMCLQRMMSKKYQEDDIIEKQCEKQKLTCYEEVQKQNANKQTKKKKVEFNLQKENDKQSTQCSQAETKVVVKQQEIKPPTQIAIVHKINNNFIVLSPEGQLLAYYISNLILLYKFADANKAIIQFGLKLQEPLCKANLLKLQGLLQYLHQGKFKESYKSFEEAQKIFKTLDTSHGQAICNCAMGYLLYTKVSLFVEKNIDENQIFMRASQKFQSAIENYQKIQHYVGESFCHKILGQIKQKMKKNYKNHVQQQKILMKKEKELQKEGKSIYIQRNQGGELLSLLIEVVNFQFDNLQHIVQPAPKEVQVQEIQQSLLNPQRPSVTGSKLAKYTSQRPLSALKKEDEKGIQSQSTNISNVKEMSTSKIPKISSQQKNEGDMYKSFQQSAQDDEKEQKEIVPRACAGTKRQRPVVNKVYQKSVSKIQKENQTESKQNIQHQEQQQLSSDTDMAASSNKQICNQKKPKVNYTTMGIEALQKYKNNKNEKKKVAEQIKMNTFLQPPTHQEQISHSQSTAGLTTTNASLISTIQSLPSRKSFHFKKPNPPPKESEKKIGISTAATSNTRNTSSNALNINMKSNHSLLNVQEEEKVFEQAVTDRSYNGSNKSFDPSNKEEEIDVLCDPQTKRFATTLGGWNNQNSLECTQTQSAPTNNANNSSQAKKQAQSSHHLTWNQNQRPSSRQSTVSDKQQLVKAVKTQQNKNISNIVNIAPETSNPNKSSKKESKLNKTECSSPFRPSSPNFTKKVNACKDNGTTSDAQSNKGGEKQQQKSQRIKFNIKATIQLEGNWDLGNQKEVKLNVESIDTDS